MNTGKFLTIPADEYHAASRSGQYMSSHLLADLHESPELYRRKTSGEIAEAEGPALALGRAAHCLILEGREAFNEQLSIFTLESHRFHASEPPSLCIITLWSHH